MTVPTEKQEVLPPVAELLRQAGELIRQDWLTRRAYDVSRARFRRATQFCLGGALFYVADKYHYPLADRKERFGLLNPYPVPVMATYVFLRDYMLKTLYKNESLKCPFDISSIASWNDEPGRTKEEVLYYVEIAAQDWELEMSIKELVREHNMNTEALYATYL